MPVFRWTSLIAAAFLGAATLASVAGAAQTAAAASVSCPWVGSSAPIPSGSASCWPR